MSTSEREKLYLPMFIFNTLVMAAVVYWYGYPFFHRYGLTTPIIDNVLAKIDAGGGMPGETKLKLLILLIIVLNTIVRKGKPTRRTWTFLLTALAVSLAVFFFPWKSDLLFVTMSVAGYAALYFVIATIARKIGGMKEPDNNSLDTFDQCTELVENEYSVNLRTLFRYKGKKRKGWINFINPFRGMLVLGTPGSGKSYSVYNPIISQFASKAFCFLTYDFKFPSLTKENYNAVLQNRRSYMDRYGREPRFCVINFDDPRYSMRCNPVSPEYIRDPADSSEIAELFYQNINKGSRDRKSEFFGDSAKALFDVELWYLRNFKGGLYCTLPHAIELMSRNYKAVFKIFQKHDFLRVKMQPFQNALKENVQQQLQGQIASAQLPLLKFCSPALYWVLSGNDFSLDLNDPDDPKILCIGNNPDRQNIYGATLAIIESRILRNINHKGKAPCAVLFDEFPTTYVPDIANTIATGRENKIAVVLGAQDKSQIKEGYGPDESEKMFNLVGNIISGQVNSTTAKSLSDTFGKEMREQMSETVGGDSTSTSRSFHFEEIMPQSRIETLTPGQFIGKVADNNDQRILKKLFCAEILIDRKKREKFEKDSVPLPLINTRDFNDSKVEEEVRRHPDYYINMYLLEELRKEQRMKAYNNDHADEDAERYTIITEGSCNEAEELEERFKALSDRDRAALLNGIVRQEQEKEVQRVLQANYDAIVRDIDSIFEQEGIPEYDEPKVEEGDEDDEGGEGGKDGGAGNMKDLANKNKKKRKEGSEMDGTKEDPFDDDADKPSGEGKGNGEGRKAGKVKGEVPFELKKPQGMKDLNVDDL